MSYTFWETVGGQRFTEGTIPALINAIEENTEEVKKLRKVLERTEEKECLKDCLSCSNSASEPSGEGDILHCMVHDEKIVNENDCCEDYT